MLALGAHYLRALDAAGISVDDAAGLVEFRLAASDEQFVTIAKLRAVRRLWARMLELSGASEDHRTMSLHAVTSRPMMTKHDPWVNMLRTCVAAFAAGVGGADSVTVLPFDSRLGIPDAFASPDRAQHLDPAGRGVTRRQGGRPCRWGVRRREAHRRPRRRRLGRARPDRVRRWRCGRPRGRLPARADRRGRHRARPPDRHAGSSVDRPHRVPEPARDVARAEAVRRRSGARPTLRPAVRGAARRACRDAGVPRDDGHDRSAHRAGHLRHQPVRGRWHRRGQRRSSRRRRSRAEGLPGTGRRPAGRLPGRPRQGVRRVGRGSREGAPRGRRPMGRPGRRVPSRASRPTTPAPWVWMRSSSCSGRGRRWR